MIHFMRTCWDDAFVFSGSEELSLFFWLFIPVLLGKGESRGKPSSESASTNNNNNMGYGFTEWIAWKSDNEMDVLSNEMNVRI